MVTAIAKAVDWITNVSNTCSSYISVSMDGISVAHEEFFIRSLGSPINGFAVFDVSINGANMELNMTTDDTDVVVNITRILVR